VRELLIIPISISKSTAFLHFTRGNCVQHDPVAQVFELLSDGHQEQALAELDRLIREEPYNGVLYAVRALVHADLGRLDQAAEDARSGRQISPDHPFVHFVVGAIALQQGAVLQAIRAAQAAQQLSPMYHEAMLLEARGRAAAGQWPRVRALAETVAEQDPGNEEAAVLATIAASVERDNVLDDAAWKGLAERFPLNPVARAGSGWTKLTAGQIGAARGEFEQALALDPTMAWAKRGLVLSLKASNPIYALLLQFFLWFGKLPSRTRMLVLVGGVLGYNFLRRAAEDEPELKPLITPVLIAYGIFVALSWLADPLLNLLLLSKAEGRRLLDADERRSALLVGACLGLALILGVIGTVSSWKGPFISAVGIALVSFAVAAAYHRQGQRRTQLLTLAGIAFGLSLVAGIVAAPLSAVCLVIAFLCVAVSTWMSHLGRDEVRGGRVVPS
jgi:tetratricopeptide (TPR) repeat protein